MSPLSKCHCEKWIGSQKLTPKTRVLKRCSRRDSVKLDSESPISMRKNIVCTMHSTMTPQLSSFWYDLHLYMRTKAMKTLTKFQDNALMFSKSPYFSMTSGHRLICQHKAWLNHYGPAFLTKTWNLKVWIPDFVNIRKVSFIHQNNDIQVWVHHWSCGEISRC